MAYNILDYSRLQEMFSRYVLGGNGYFIGRIGGSDWDLVSWYYLKVFIEKTITSSEIVYDPAFCYKADHLTRWNGFYDTKGNPGSYTIFCDRMLGIYRQFDLVTMGGGALLTAMGLVKEGGPGYLVEEGNEFRCALINTVITQPLGDYLFVEDMYGFFYNIFPLLAGKKVLVCSPFVDSIKKQFANRHRLFSNYSRCYPGKDISYPDFELVTLKTPVTYTGAQNYPHENWFQTSEALCQEMARLDFDVALLGCGCYAMDLGVIAKALGKGAIYVGGILQMFFGIYGRRYLLNRAYLKFLNNYWIRPIEKPDISISEDEPSEAWGAYW